MEPIIYADGSPKGMVVCVVDGIIQPVKIIDVNTNNEAEWEGLLYALSFCKPGQLTRIYLDSMDIVKWWNEQFKTKEPRMKAYKDKARQFYFTNNLSATVSWCPRERNLAGKRLEKIG